MKKRAIITLALIIATFDVRADIAALHWMTGCWALSGQDEGSVEHWSMPAGKSMIGFNRVVSAGNTIAFEYLRIIEEDNDLILIASPSGQETASFASMEVTGSRVIFENPDHDFPQRIIYRLDENRNLIGRIEGVINGAPRSVDFPMTRTACDDNTGRG